MTSACGLLVVLIALSAADLHAPRSIKWNAETLVKRSDAVHVHRQRRQAQTLTPGQIKEVVDHHNVLRAKEGADNMELMTWSDFLASLAVTWADGCDFSHGQPPLGNNPPYTVIGQNLYAATGSGVDLAVGIQAWYDEIADYDYDTLNCTAVCGHYTQVVWSSSREVGCGYKLCSTLANTSPTLTNAYYFVCNYGPAGNLYDMKPYTKGPACSKCGSDAGWCNSDGLCNSACPSPGADCTCAAICYNCAALDPGSCRCVCANGWYGADCSVFCEDKDSQCNANPGWPPSWCNHPDYSSFTRRGCPAMCNLCIPDASAVPGRCPPVTVNSTYIITLSPEATATTKLITTASASAIFARCHHAAMAFAVFTLALTSLSAAVLL